MISYYKCDDLDTIDQIKTNFVEDGAYNKEQIAYELKVNMATNPNDVCVIICKDETGKILGHIVGWLPEDRHYAWIDQVWSSVGKKRSLKGFEYFVKWCTEKGRHEIRMETSRNKMAMARSYGFEEHSTTMRKAL